MNTFKIRAIPCVLLFLLALLCTACSSAESSSYDDPTFKNITVELGSDLTLTPALFYDGNVKPDTVRFSEEGITAVDLNRVDVYDITLHHITEQNGDDITFTPVTVTLTVRDTTPPTVTFRDHTADVGYQPDGEDFVESAEDLSPLAYDVTVADPEAFLTTVTVTVTDAYGNMTKSEQTLTLNWLKPAYTLELGTTLREPDLLLGIGYGNGAFTEEQLASVGATIGDFELTAASGGHTQTVKITVADTTPPTIELRNLHRLPGETATMEDFIVSTSDLTAVTTELVTPLTMTEAGSYTIVIAAVDESGNRTEATTQLIISKNSDVTAPVFKGLDAMSVVRGSSPDYLDGVSATDKAEGAVRFTVDASAVNINKAGTYYITYTASDSSGNVATKKRKITVSAHTAEDTAALVKEMSDQIGYDFTSKKDEVLAIRDFIRTIRYNTDWGDPDPTYYGFTTWKGNCKVHATTLKDILDLRGYETNLIWVKEEYTPHYWVQIKLDGKWYHIDATPVGTHNKAPALMNDEERLYYLREKNYTSPRLWDTSLWPACP